MQKFALFLCGVCFINGATAACGVKNETTSRVPDRAARSAFAPEKPAPDAAAASLESQVLQEINALRKNPAAYIAYLEELRKNYAGNELRLPGQTAIITNEGVAALDEAVAFLKTVKPARDLTGINGLNDAANTQLQYLIKNNKTGHLGDGGSTPDARVTKFGAWSGEVKELISYNAASPRQMVLNWLIDDGVKTRGHRLSLLKPNFQSIGITTGDSSTRGKMCVLVLTETFTAKP